MNTDDEHVLDMVWRALDTVIDPELGLPITDLGLVYDVEISDGHVTVSMTTTTPVCPLGAHLAGITRDRITEPTGVESVEVAITHEPVWTPGRLSPRARRLLGVGG